MSEPLRNDELPAGSPMWFRCIECRSLIVVPEMYLLKPRLCPDCGGAWCRSEDPVALRRQVDRVEVTNLTSSS